MNADIFNQINFLAENTIFSILSRISPSNTTTGVPLSYFNFNQFWSYLKSNERTAVQAWPKTFLDWTTLCENLILRRTDQNHWQEMMSLSCTVFEIQRHIGRKLQILKTSPVPCDLMSGNLSWMCLTIQTQCHENVVDRWTSYYSTII